MTKTQIYLRSSYFGPGMPFRFGLIFVSMVWLVACESSGSVQNILYNTGTHYLSTPDISSNSILEEAKNSKILVSQVNINAPKKGDILYKVGTNYGNRYSSFPIEAEYVLEDEFETAASEAARYLFDVKADSRSTANIDASVEIHFILASNGWCKYWDVTTAVYLDIQLQTADGKRAKARYRGASEDTYCATLVWFPSGNAISGQLEEALQEAVRKAVENREALVDSLEKVRPILPPTAEGWVT